MRQWDDLVPGLIDCGGKKKHEIMNDLHSGFSDRDTYHGLERADSM